MPAPVTREKSDLPAFQRAQDERIRGLAEGRLHRDFQNVAQTGHGIQTTPADNADFSLLQEKLLVKLG